MKKNSDKITGFFINIATSGKWSGKSDFGMTDNLIRYVLLNFICMFGILILAAYNVLNFQKGLYDIVAASTGMILVALTCIILARTKVPQVIISFILMAFYGLLCIWLNHIKQVLGFNFLFIYVYPLLAIMLLGLRYGVILSAVLLLLVDAEMIFPGLAEFEYHIEAAIRVLASYLLVFTATIVMEFTRKTKDKRIEDQSKRLEELKREAEAANRAKSDFLAVMSHEIRTPLNAVIGLSQIELQNDAELPASARTNIVQIHRSGSYLLGIINDILDISKIESENFELVPAEYDSNSLIGDAVNLNRIRIGSKPINFVLEIQSGFPRTLTGDELRVKQILNNLLSNAAKYTQQGTITLKAECIQRLSREGAESANVLVRFTVKDTGIGIHNEDRGKLFENYAQLDFGVNRKTEGTGLGLPIALKLARMMGGTITVESEYGKGSVFIAEIMQERTDAETLGEKTAEELRNFLYVSSSEEEFTRSVVPYGKVLVVDDIPANLLVARGLLQPYGLDVDTASSGKEAIEKIQSSDYDLIGIDHMMPEMNGIETAAAIRALKNTAPVIALTANAMHGMKEYYLEHGFEDYLSKPINAKALDEILIKWIKPKNNEQSSKSGIDNFSIAVESRHLDKLKHYCASFEIGKEYNTAYFQNFTALVRTFSSQSLHRADAALQEQAALLVEAGQKKDVQTIRELLPAFCNAMSNYQKARGGGQNGGSINEILSRLKKAAQDGGGKAETILGELGQAKLDPAERELYFTLYDLLLRNNAEKAIEAINNFFGAENND